MATGTRLNWALVGAPYTVDKQEIIDVINPTETTANLALLAADINIYDKFAGRMVFDITKGQPVWADGPLVGDTWSLSTGVVASTPI